MCSTLGTFLPSFRARYVSARFFLTLDLAKASDSVKSNVREAVALAYHRRRPGFSPGMILLCNRRCRVSLLEGSAVVIRVQAHLYMCVRCRRPVVRLSRRMLDVVRSAGLFWWCQVLSWRRLFGASSLLGVVSRGAGCEERCLASCERERMPAGMSLLSVLASNHVL